MRRFSPVLLLLASCVAEGELLGLQPPPPTDAGFADAGFSPPDATVPRDAGEMTPPPPPPPVGTVCGFPIGTRMCFSERSGSLYVWNGVDLVPCETPTRVSVRSAQPFAVIGDKLYRCEERLIELSLTDGSERVAPLECRGVANWDNRLLVRPDFQTMAVYDDFEAVLANRRETWRSPSAVANYAPLGSTMVTSWHSTDEVDVYELPDTAPARTITLAWDGWATGLAQLSRNRVILTRGIRGDFAEIYDLESGERIALLEEFAGFTNIACTSPPL